MKFSILGAGKVGIAIGHRLKKLPEYHLHSFCTKTLPSLQIASAYLGTDGTTSIREAAEEAQLIILSVPDQEISNVLNELMKIDLSDRYIFHVSGSLGMNVLSQVRAKGANTGRLHPLRPFADIKTGIEALDGTYFGITAHDSSRELAYKIVKALDGFGFDVPDGGSVLYHASACIASNYLVTLFENAMQSALEAGINEDEYFPALLKLARATLDNIEKLGTGGAMTGPIARGAIETVKDHMKFVQGVPELGAVYKVLGLQTARLSLRAGKLDIEKFDKMITFLGGGNE